MIQVSAAEVSAPVCAALADTLGFTAVDEDTLEAFDVVIEEEKDRSTLYKEIAAFTIAAAMVTLFVITIIGSDEEEEEKDTGNGKPLPSAQPSFRISITR